MNDRNALAPAPLPLWNGRPDWSMMLAVGWYYAYYSPRRAHGANQLIVAILGREDPAPATTLSERYYEPYQGDEHYLGIATEILAIEDMRPEPGPDCGGDDQ